MTSQETMPLRRKLQIKPGLILVRLTEEGNAPTAEFCISVPDVAEDSISLVSNPLGQDNMLRKGGDCLILRCVKTCSVELLAQPKQAQGRISGRVQVEYLTDQGTKRAQAPTAPFKKAAQPHVPKSGADACFLSHIVNCGDRYFGLGEWIGSPSRSDALEALGIRRDFKGLPKLMLRDQLTRQIAEPGQLLGTRGRNSPLRAVDIWLADSQSHERLQVEALFRKAGHLRLIGESVSLVGSDKTDVLLGLRVSLVSPLRKRGRQDSSSRVKIYPAT